MIILTDAFVWAVVLSIRINRARYTLYKKILDLLDEEAHAAGKALHLLDREEMAYT